MSGFTGGRVTAVCSWSLRPVSPADLADAVRTCGLTAVQLSLDPLRRGEWPVGGTRDALASAGISVISGMMELTGEDYSTLESIRRTGGVRPDETWPENLAAATGDAAIAEELGLRLVSFHAGFLPHDPADPERIVMLERIRAIATAFAARGIAVALETGQESAETLLSVLQDLGRDDVGVNFDPANMILYGMGDPVEAVRRLGPHVWQVHVKDAEPATTPGTWGREVPVGTGTVDWSAFLGAVDEVAADVPLVIEREAGDARATDVRKAVREIERFAGTTA